MTHNKNGKVVTILDSENGLKENRRMDGYFLSSFETDKTASSLSEKKLVISSHCYANSVLGLLGTFNKK